MEEEKKQISLWEAFKEAFILFWNAKGIFIPVILFLHLILLSCITLFVLLNAYYASVVGILLLVFVFLPFFYSFVLMIKKLFNEEPLSLMDFYFGFIRYYKDGKIGIFSSLVNLILSYLIIFACLYISLVSYDLFNPNALNEIIEAYLQGTNSDIGSMVLNMPNFIYYLLPFLGLGFLFPMCFIYRKSVRIFTNLPVKTVNMVTKRAYSILMHKKNNVRKSMNSLTGIARFTFCFAFYIGFVLSGAYLNLLGTIKFEIIIILALGIGLLLAFIFLTPLYVLSYEIISLSMPLYYAILLETLNNMRNEIAKNNNQSLLDTFDEINAPLNEYLSKRVKIIKK